MERFQPSAGVVELTPGPRMTSSLSSQETFSSTGLFNSRMWRGCSSLWRITMALRWHVFEAEERGCSTVRWKDSM